MRASSSRYKPIKRLSAFLGKFAAGKCFVLEDGDVGDSPFSHVGVDDFDIASRCALRRVAYRSAYTGACRRKGRNDPTGRDTPFRRIP